MNYAEYSPEEMEVNSYAIMMKLKRKVKRVFEIKRMFRAIKRRIHRRSFWKHHGGLICDYQDIIYNDVSLNGTGNRILVGEWSSLRNCSIIFNGNNCTLEIKSGTNLCNVSFWFEDEYGLIQIGTGTTMEEGCQFASVEGTKVIIGNDCMFSHEVDVRSTDSHSITDLKGIRINPSEDIVIGNHVWIGIRSTILKGSVVKDNSIIGACSLITGNTVSKENAILAGVPAKIVKEDVNWDRKRIACHKI